MNDREWTKVALVLDHGWSGEFTDEAQEVYAVFLKEMPAEQVMAALRLLANEGKPFMPAVSEIVKAVNDMQEDPVPSWPEAWLWLERGMKWACDRRIGEDGAHERVAERCHEVVSAFARAEGGLLAMSRQPFYDEQYGALRIKDLKGRWEEFVGVARERLSRGLALSSAGRTAVGPSKLGTVALLNDLRPEAERPALEAGDAD